jgi:dihydropyrimidinase
MTVNAVITGGTVVTPDKMFSADVTIADGTIAGLVEDADESDADEVIDATDKLVFPGIVDPHVHIDDMFSIDSYETATRAAARGGITTVVDFAWQAWEGDTSIWDGEGTLAEGIERKQRKAENSYIDYSLHGGITRPDPAVLKELSDAIDEGVTSFKMFTAYEIGLPNGFIGSVFDRLADLDGVAVLHTEDGSVCDQLTEQFERAGRSDATWYPDSRPDYAEAMAAEDAVRMATEMGCKYYGIHTSCRKAADVLADFRTAHPDLVRAETCVHYTAHDRSVYDRQGNLPMIAPPIRTEDDVDAMFEHLTRGTLDVVSTDHCAFKADDKEGNPWWDSSFGVNTLQRSLPVFHEVAVNQRGLSYPTLVRLLSTNPARLFGLPQKGTLAPGTDADIVVFDPEQTQPIDAADNESQADYSIYDGWDVTGRVETTLVRGETVFDGDDITGDAGHGTFVERTVPEWDA